MNADLLEFSIGVHRRSTAADLLLGAVPMRHEITIWQMGFWRSRLL
jgi:hypothetical protein